MIALDSWRDLEGYAAGHGASSMNEMTIDAFCSYIWWIATKNLEQADRDSFNAKLWRPPPGERAQGPWAPEAETAGLSALKASLG